MTLYYQDDAVTLYHGNCLTEHREWLEADVLVTDPPYGISWTKGENRRSKSRKHRGIDNDGDTTARDTAIQAWGDRPAVVFGTWAEQVPGAKQTLVWQKPIDAGVVGSVCGYRRDTELMFLLGEHERRPAGRSSVITTRGSIHGYLEGHPHSKPTGLMRALIEWTSGVVADPFAGSGSTLVAAKSLGRKSIGVELDERYCEIAAKRLSQGVLDLAGA